MAARMIFYGSAMRGSKGRKPHRGSRGRAPVVVWGEAAPRS